MTVKIIRTLLCMLVAQSFVFTAHSAQVESSMLPAINYPAVISPDGQLAAYAVGTRADGGICTVKIASPNTPVCVQVVGPPLLEFIVWSPDSSQVVFANESFVSGYDSDIYVLTAGETTVTNLTSEDPERDGLEGRPQARKTRPDKEEGALLDDIAPIWSHDGQHIYFLRYDARAEVKPMWLMRISADGGEPEQVLKINDDPIYSTGTLTWTGESSLLLTGWWDGTLFQVNLNNGTVLEQSLLQDASHESPRILSVSTNGKQFTHTLAFTSGPFSRGPLFFLVEWDDNSITDIQTLVTNSEGRVYWPVLLPEGTSRVGDVVYVTPSGSSSVEVMLLHLESGEAISLGLLNGVTFSNSRNEGVRFVGNDTLAITTQDGTWLFTIPARFAN